MADSSRVGEILAGKYQLEALLGSGGVGVVYRAQNTLVGRTVAIKLMRPEHVSDPKVVGRFMREARAANIVRHVNVVDVLDIDQDEQGTPFIVQEFLEGQDLGRLVKGHRSGLPVDWVLATMIPIVEAVGFAHARGVVHRDLKPENVFLANVNGETVPKLLDFGISYIRPSPGDIRMTATGTTLGTPAFMSPEQLGGTQAVDARSDVWALGVILFESLSGRLPFDADSAAMLFAQIAWAVPPRLDEVAPHVSRDLSRAVGRCLRRDKDERYPSAAELVRDLRLIQAGGSVEPSQKRSLPPQAPLFQVAEDAVDLVPRPPPPPRTPRIDIVPGNEVVSASIQHLRGSASGPVGVERFGSAVQAPESSRRGATNTEVVPLAEQIEEAARDARSGIALATLRPKATADDDDDESDGVLEASKFWAIAAIALTMLTTLAGLMAVLHRTDGWPLTTWLRPLFSGTSPGMDLGVSLLAIAGGISIGARVFAASERAWGLLITACAMIGVGLPTALRAGVLLFARHDLFADGAVPGTLLGLAIIPLGVGVHAIKMSWDYWGSDEDLRSRATSVGLAALGTGAMFAAAEIMRASLM